MTAPLLIPSLLVDGKFFNELKEFGENLGLIFQITDDILDETGTLTSIGKTPHKDKNSDKFTSIKVYGLEGAKNKSQQLYQRCKEILNEIPNSKFLSSFLDTIYFRKK